MCSNNCYSQSQIQNTNAMLDSNEKMVAEE